MRPEPGFSPALLLYRLAWEPALLLARAAAAGEKAFRKIAGKGLWPPRWRVGDRLYGNSGNLRVTHPESGNADAVWMHAASLGECKGLWAVAEALARNVPRRRLVLTATTTEGFDYLAARVREAEAAQERDGQGAHGGLREIRLAPLDHPRVVRGFLRAHGVRALVLFEVELWPHFILETKRNGGEVLWISALCGRGASRARAVLGRIDRISAQTESDARRLRALGARDVEAGGDLRGLHYLGNALAPASRAPSPEPGGWEARAGIALVSFHADELGAITPALRNLPRDIPVYVIPRKREEWPRFAAALEPLGFAFRSRNPGAARQIVDAFGLVADILGGCRAAVIGGSFAPHGGHNLWEPLLAGVNVSLGPFHESQRYLADKLAPAGLLRVSRDFPDLAALHAAPDPGAECRRFCEAEASLLQGGLDRLETRLKRFPS